MADKALGALTEATALDAADLLYAVVGGNSRKVQRGNFFKNATALTASDPFTFTQTWNAAGVTFNSLLVDITASASAAGSTLADFKVDGSSVNAIKKDGSIYLNGALTSTAMGGIGITGPAGTNIHVGALLGGVYLGNTDTFGATVHIALAGLRTKSNATIGFSADTTSYGTLDAALARAATKVIKVTDGSTGGGGLQLPEMTAPTAPAADNMILFAEDNGAGKTRIVARFPSGADVVLATQA